LLASPFASEQAQTGLGQVRLPARFEVRKLGRKTLILDVGHNPDAIAAFISTWRIVFGKQRCALVFGAMKDKDWREALRQLASISHTLYACQAAGTRPASSFELAHFAPEAGFMTALDSGSVEQAAAAALADEAPLVAIVGSHYVVGEALGAGLG
jgi:dihydrofolate synthase/folylpolyglutamate synthase